MQIITPVLYNQNKALKFDLIENCVSERHFSVLGWAFQPFIVSIASTD